MHIEVSKTYTTRDGRQAIVQKISGSSVYPYQGCILETETMDQEDVLWNKDGFYINRSNPDENDLVRIQKEAL